MRNETFLQPSNLPWYSNMAWSSSSWAPSCHLNVCHVFLIASPVSSLARRRAAISSEDLLARAMQQARNKKDVSCLGCVLTKSERMGIVVVKSTGGARAWRNASLFSVQSTVSTPVFSIMDCIVGIGPFQISYFLVYSGIKRVWWPVARSMTMDEFGPSHPVSQEKRASWTNSRSEPLNGSSGWTGASYIINPEIRLFL